MNQDTSRRRFLHVVAQGGTAACAASLGLGGGLGCGAGGGSVSAGSVKSLAVGTLTVVSGDSVAIGRDANGVYALSLICTHESCDMSSQGTVSSTHITCSCHGSIFDGNGAVLQGPASSPLPHYAVTIDATTGAMTIDMNTVVVATTRTKVA